MTSKFTVIGDQTKITFEWTAPTTLMQEIVGAAANLLWNRGKGDHVGTPMVPATETTPEIPEVEAVFADLTNVQKLAIVELYLKDVVVDLANAFKDEAAVKATVVLERETKYVL